MSLSVWFWIVFVIGVLLGGYEGYCSKPALPRNIFVLALFFFLGWAVFGAPIR